jgi:hypothetical protein
VSRTSPGNYALGYLDADTFMVFYVGRSDCDVKRRLHEWVGAPSRYEKYAPLEPRRRGVSSSGVSPPRAPLRRSIAWGWVWTAATTRFAYSYAASAEDLRRANPRSRVRFD